MSSIATGMAIASAVGAGGQLAGGLLGGKKSSIKKISTFSKDQKNVNTLLYDLLMGNTRDNKGRVVSQSPWIDQLLQKRAYQKVAPLTDRQNNVLGMADSLAQRVQSRQGPDQGYLNQLSQGILPKDMKRTDGLYYAAGGGTAKPGDTVVVGEDGPEVLKVQPDGQVQIIPNPKTVQNKQSLAAGLGKSVKLQNSLNTDTGMVAGGKVDPKRWWTDASGKGQYVDYNAPQAGYDWNSTSYGNDLRGQFDAYLADQYKNKQPGENWGWYNNLQGNKYGGDITNVPYQRKGDSSYAPSTTVGKINTNYYDKLNQWWQGLDTKNSNSALDTAMNTLKPEQYNNFNSWLNGAGNQYNMPDNQLVMRNNQVTFADPFSVDMGNVNGMLDAYNKYYTSEGGPGYVAPQVVSPDFNSLLSQISPNNAETDYTKFNDFLNTYKGGALKGQGVAWDPTTGNWKLTAEDKNFPGMQQALADYQAANANSGASGANPEVTPGTTPTDTNANTVGSPQDIQQISQMLQGYGENFDPTKANEMFNQAVADPAMQQYENQIKPELRQSFAGDNFFGSGRQRAEANTLTQLGQGLNAQRASYLYNAEQAHKNRALNAASQLMNLQQLPTQILGQQASVDNVNATTANVFNNMEWTNQLSESKINNQDLTTMAALWSLFSPEQSVNQNQLNADMTNLFAADGGFSPVQMMNLLMGYQNQTQTAVVT